AAALTIRRAAGECLKRVPLEQKLRLLGVRISALQADDDPDLQTPPQQGELDLSPRDA
ncbi:MAG: polymerase, partial [Pseudomonadota bacterium]